MNNKQNIKDITLADVRAKQKSLKDAKILEIPLDATTKTLVCVKRITICENSNSISIYVSAFKSLDKWIRFNGCYKLSFEEFINGTKEYKEEAK